jgi:hypothetical protein
VYSLSLILSVRVRAHVIIFYHLFTASGGQSIAIYRSTYNKFKIERLCVYRRHQIYVILVKEIHESQYKNLRSRFVLLAVNFHIM